MRRWVPTLCLLMLVIPYSDGTPLPPLTGPLFDQFNRLTARPNPWPPVSIFLSVIAALAVPINRKADPHDLHRR